MSALATALPPRFERLPLPASGPTTTSRTDKRRASRNAVIRATPRSAMWAHASQECLLLDVGRALEASEPRSHEEGDREYNHTIDGETKKTPETLLLSGRCCGSEGVGKEVIRADV